MTDSDMNAQLEMAKAELKRSYELRDYDAVDVAWVVTIRMANFLEGKSEHARLLALLDIPLEDRIRALLSHEAVDALLSLDPPLEAVPAMTYERLDADRTARELLALRIERDKAPKIALFNLVEVLKRIRNRRAHGFKTPNGLRDKEILGAAAPILRAIGELAVEVISNKLSHDAG